MCMILHLHLACKRASGTRPKPDPREVDAPKRLTRRMRWDKSTSVREEALDNGWQALGGREYDEAFRTGGCRGAEAHKALDKGDQMLYN